MTRNTKERNTREKRKKLFTTGFYLLKSKCRKILFLVSKISTSSEISELFIDELLNSTPRHSPAMPHRRFNKIKIFSKKVQYHVKSFSQFDRFRNFLDV